MDVHLVRTFIAAATRVHASASAVVDHTASFAVEGSSMTDDGTTISVRSTSTFSCCPSCGLASGRVHSHYRRQINDLPLAGRSVKLIATVRRFWCEAVRCGQSIFAERFADGIVAPWARRTGRLDGLVHHLGLALRGRPAASFARRLMLPVSNDTLLRVVRRRGCPPVPPQSSSASMIGHGGETSATARSFAISSGVGRSAFCTPIHIISPERVLGNLLKVW